jgi:glutathione S-transferase
MLEETLSPRLLREALTGADFYLWMLSSWNDDSAGLYRRFPKLGRLAEEISERPAVAKVVQLNQG